MGEHLEVVLEAARPHNVLEPVIPIRGYHDKTLFKYTLLLVFFTPKEHVIPIVLR